MEGYSLFEKDFPCSLQYSIAVFYLRLNLDVREFLDEVSWFDDWATISYSKVLDDCLFSHLFGRTLAYRSGISCLRIVPFLPVLSAECSVFVL